MTLDNGFNHPQKHVGIKGILLCITALYNKSAKGAGVYLTLAEVTG